MEGSVGEGDDAFVKLLVFSGTTVVDTLMLPSGTTKSVTLWTVVVVVVVVALSAAAGADCSGILSAKVSSVFVVVVEGVVLELED